MSGNEMISCESCGADLVLKKGETSVKCGFCGTLNKPTENSKNPINKTKILMFNGAESDNWEDVSKYATKVLEDDPGDYEAWFYKGAAAGWTSRHIDDPSKEITNCFRNAFANSDDSNISEIMNIFATKGVELLMALADGSRAFAQEHGYINVGDFLHNGYNKDTMMGHIGKVFGFIDVAYLLTELNRNDRVEKINPAIDALFLRLYSFLYTKISIEGCMTKKNPFNLIEATFSFRYDPESELGLKWIPRVDEILNAYSNKAYSDEDLSNYSLSERDFSDPRNETAQESTEGACFVATAVYTSKNHSNLIVLRSFRDNTLRNSMLGTKFIKFYYTHGPRFAIKVKQSNLLKSLVKPFIDFMVLAIKLFKIG